MNVVQCKHCKQPVSFARRATDTTRWVCLDAAPVAQTLAHSQTCLVVSGVYAYHPQHLEEVLELRRMIPSREAAEMSRQEFPWHTIHHCKESTDE